MSTPALPRIDSNAISTFTCGQCHALALAIHEETRLPLAGLWLSYEDPEITTPAHVVAVLPNGSLLDIQGPGAEDRWEGPVKRMLLKEVKNLHNRDYREPLFEYARPYAKAVLEAYGIQPFNIKPRRKS